MMRPLMAQVERWHRVRQGFMGGYQITNPRMPLWRRYARAVAMANDPCDETTMGRELSPTQPPSTAL